MGHLKFSEEISVPQPVDVGSILGGRYKVTGRILASAENDVILDGLDQVLNRPVSILVSAPENTANLTQSAREVATGTRVSNVSILDLGTQDGQAYIIANRTTPADLLDLVVPTEPQLDDDVYREPFFTDTLGTEIFGSARDAAPSDTAYVYEDDSPLTPASPMPIAPIAAAATAAIAAAAVAPPTTPSPSPSPKVTLWDEDDFNAGTSARTEPAVQGRAAGKFPADARASSDDYFDDDGAEYDDDENAPRASGRWLTAAIVTVLVVAALFFAVTKIGSLFNGDNVADGKSSSSQQGQQTTEGGSATQAPAPVVVPPVITGLTDITVFAPGVTNYAEPNFPRLKDAIDGNKGTYWPTVEYSSDNFANLTDNINLVVALAEESTISSVTINQIGGSGGQFNILTNNKPTLEGATKIGSGSFSAPDFTLQATPPVKAKYVIINFTQLPKLQPFLTYPYGLKIAEISVK